MTQGAAPAAGPQGTLTGVLELRWANEDGFIYVPVAGNALTYTRGDRVVRPDRMWTDGGSIPRVLWPLPGLSPWTFGPAYALHDWLFNRHRCHKGTPQDDTSFEEANAILDDAILILIARKQASSHGEVHRMIRWAVDNFGRAAWDGPCIATPKLETLAEPGVLLERMSAD